MDIIWNILLDIYSMVLELGAVMAQLAESFLVTAQIFVLTLVFSMPLGLVVAFGRMSQNRIIRAIVKAYISVMRGTPLMLQLIVVYFAPYYVFGIKLSSF